MSCSEECQHWWEEGREYRGCTDSFTLLWCCSKRRTLFNSPLQDYPLSNKTQYYLLPWVPKPKFNVSHFCILPCCLTVRREGSSLWGHSVLSEMETRSHLKEGTSRCWKMAAHLFFSSAALSFFISKETGGSSLPMYQRHRNPLQWNYESELLDTTWIVKRPKNQYALPRKQPNIPAIAAIKRWLSYYYCKFFT